MYKNVANQVWVFHAKNKTTGSDLTGETNTTLTLYVSKDGGTPAALACVAANTIVELDSTNMPGWYKAPLAQAETNGNELLLGGKTSSTNGVVEGRIISTNIYPTALHGPVDGH